MRSTTALGLLGCYSKVNGEEICVIGVNISSVVYHRSSLLNSAALKIPNVRPGG